MAVSTFRIESYTVQVLAKKTGEEASASIIVRLYEQDGVCRGVAVFEDHGSGLPPKPIGDFEARTATVNYDLSYYPAFIDVLRLETPLFWKIAWTQVGTVMVVSHAAIDTKHEILGEFFKYPPDT